MIQAGSLRPDEKKSRLALIDRRARAPIPRPTRHEIARIVWLNALR
jgi:hypothetical protein